MEVIKDIFVRSACAYYCCHLWLLTTGIFEVICKHTKNFKDNFQGNVKIPFLPKRPLYCMVEAVLWRNYLGLWETATTPDNHGVLLHWGVFQIFSKNSNKNLWQKNPLNFRIQSMFVKVSRTEVKLNPAYQSPHYKTPTKFNKY